MINELNKIFNNWKINHLENSLITLEEFLSQYNGTSQDYKELFSLDYFLNELSSVLPSGVELNLINMFTEGFRFQIVESKRENGSYIVFEDYLDEMPFNNLDTFKEFIIRLQNNHNN